MPWNATDLERLADAAVLHITTYRKDGTTRPLTPIWGIRVGDDLYVRLAYGAEGGWYQRAVRRGRARVRANGIETDVALTRVEDPAVVAAVGQAYRAKYADDQGSLKTIGIPRCGRRERREPAAGARRGTHPHAQPRRRRHPRRHGPARDLGRSPSWAGRADPPCRRGGALRCADGGTGTRDCNPPRPVPRRGGHGQPPRGGPSPVRARRRWPDRRDVGGRRHRVRPAPARPAPGDPAART